MATGGSAGEVVGTLQPQKRQLSHSWLLKIKKAPQSIVPESTMPWNQRYCRGNDAPTYLTQPTARLIFLCSLHTDTMACDMGCSCCYRFSQC